MKIFAISKDKQFYRIGNSTSDSKWYGLTPKVVPFMESINKGDEIEMTHEKTKEGKLVLTHVKKTSSGTGFPSASKPSYNSYQKDPAVQESIKRQAIGNMTSRTMIALASSIDLTNVEEVMETIYKKYQTLVK